MNVFGIGLPEMVLILAVALLIFGPKKLPEIGRSLGKAIRGFQDASREFENEFKREAEKLERDNREPMKATLEDPERQALSPSSESQAALEEVAADAAASDGVEAEAGTPKADA